MVNRTVEKMLFVIVLFVFISLWTLMTHVSIENIPFENNIRVVDSLGGILFFSVLMTLPIRYFYCRFRNKRFIDKIYRLSYEGKHDEALALIDKVIVNRPGFYWLQAEKAILLAFSGNYTLFISFSDALIYPQKHFKFSSFYRLEVIKYTIDFLLSKNEVEINPTYITNERWPGYITYQNFELYMAINKYKAYDFVEAIRFSNRLLSRRPHFLKFVAIFILIKSYNGLNDSEMENRYRALLHQESGFGRYMNGINI